MEKYEADLLQEASIESSTATMIYRVFHWDQELSPEELTGALEKLEELGWIEPTPKGHWLISKAGAEALAQSREWEFVVTDVKRSADRHQVVVGDLRRGDIFQLEGDFFDVTRAGLSVAAGVVHRIGDDSSGQQLTLALEVGMFGRFEMAAGDVLNMADPVTGSASAVIK